MRGKLAGLTIATALAACSSGSSNPVISPEASTAAHTRNAGASVTADLTQARVAAPSILRSRAQPRSGSWMEPDAKSNALLYVSDVDGNAVYVFNYPKLSSAGMLTGFSEPQGMCAIRRPTSGSRTRSISGSSSMPTGPRRPKPFWTTPAGTRQGARSTRKAATSPPRTSSAARADLEASAFSKAAQTRRPCISTNTSPACSS